MKRLFLFLFTIYSLVDYAQIIDHDIVLQNEEIVNNSRKFLDGETLKFHAKDGHVTENMKWSLNIIEKEGVILIEDDGKRITGGNIPVAESEYGTDVFSFKISPNLFSQVTYKKEITFEGDSSVYFTGKVYLYKDGTPKDSLSLFFNVLPSQPKIIEASLSGNFDFQNMRYNPYASLKVKFLSSRLEKSDLLYYGVDSTLDFPIAIYEDTKLTTGDVNVIEFNHANWGEYYLVAPRNKYGTIKKGYAISTTACISDTTVYNAIRKYQDDTNIGNVNIDKDVFVLEKKILYIKGNYSSKTTISIFTLEGLPLLTNDTEKVINLFFLNSGIYVVRMKLNNEIITKKIHIQ